MIIFDAHCDTLSVLSDSNQSFLNSKTMVRPDMMDLYSGYVQVFAAFINPHEQNPMKRAICLADRFYTEAENAQLRIITSARTLNDVIEKRKKGAVLSLENGNALCGNIEVLNMFYALGFRAITLTWNGSNELGYGAVDSNGKGLTDFGKIVVRRMNELGMVIDVSHLSEKGFWDVAELSNKPFMASHSNAMSICNHPRNLSNAQLKAISEKGGVIGINLYPLFLNGTEKADVTDVIRHIEHIISLAGEDRVGIGTDFDGISHTPYGLSDVSCLYKIFDELTKLGYSSDTLKNISHRNFVRLFAECLK